MKVEVPGQSGNGAPVGRVQQQRVSHQEAIALAGCLAISADPLPWVMGSSLPVKCGGEK